jgi:hypothetical protein
MTDQGGMQQDAGKGGQQVGSAGGDVKQLKVGDLLNLANQQNIDVEALNNLVGDIQAEVDAGNIALGGEAETK